MRIEERKIILKNGKTCILRSAEEKDAQQLVDYLKNVAGETEFLLRTPEEATVTIEKELAMIADMEAAPRKAMIVAEIEGEIAGNCGLYTVGKYHCLHHRCSIGISVQSKFWGLSIGTVMMQLLFEKAKEAGYEQMELEVVGANDRGIALYKKMGFAETGRFPDAMKRDDGSYCDTVQMMKKL